LQSANLSASLCNALARTSLPAFVSRFAARQRMPITWWWRFVVLAALNDFPRSGGPSLYQYSLLIMLVFVDKSFEFRTVECHRWKPVRWRHLHGPNVAIATLLLSLQVRVTGSILASKTVVTWEMLLFPRFSSGDGGSTISERRKRWTHRQIAFAKRNMKTFHDLIGQKKNPAEKHSAGFCFFIDCNGSSCRPTGPF
jgi:hypothetical protein